VARQALAADTDRRNLAVGKAPGRIMTCRTGGAPVTGQPRVVKQGFAERRAGRIDGRLCWRLQAGSRLLTDRPVEMERIGEGGRAFLLRETDEAEVEALIARLERVTAAAAAVIDRLLAEGGEDGPD